jgi:hypothetical protein
MRTVGPEYTHLMRLVVRDEDLTHRVDRNSADASKHVRLCPLRHSDREIRLRAPGLRTRRIGALLLRGAGKKAKYAGQKKENAAHGNGSPWGSVVRTAWYQEFSSHSTKLSEYPSILHVLRTNDTRLF